MRAVLLLALAACAMPARAQPCDSVSYYNSSRAFLWPQPFTHVPQTFEAQAVRFTAPAYSGPARLDAIDVYVDQTSRSRDNFNDTLRVAFLLPDADGRPDPAAPAGAPFDVEFAELTPGRLNRIALPPANAVHLGDGVRDVWVVLELMPAGLPDTLVLVTGPKTDPPLFRAAARVAGAGWRMLAETQFSGEYNYQVAAHFCASVQSAVAESPGAGRLRIEGVAPQPAREGVVVAYENDGGGAASAALYDVLGRRVRLVEVPPGATRVRIETAGLPAGLYLVQIRAGAGQASHPVVVAR